MSFSKGGYQLGSIGEKVGSYNKKKKKKNGNLIVIISNLTLSAPSPILLILPARCQASRKWPNPFKLALISFLGKRLTFFFLEPWK